MNCDFHVSLREEEIQRAVGDLADNGWASIELPSKVDEAYQLLAEDALTFFARPASAKRPFDIRDSTGHRGWVPTDEQGDYSDEGQRRYEAFDIGRPAQPTDVVHHPLRGNNRWPADPAGRRLGERAEKLYGGLADLAGRIGDAICDDLDVAHVNFHELGREPVSQLRLIHYLAPAVSGQLPAVTVNADGETVIDLRDAPSGRSAQTTPPAAVTTSDDEPSAMGAHTDYEFFTLLYQTKPGTQVLDDNGDWIDVPHDGTLTLLAGDMLDIFSGGRYVSTLHRAAASVEAGRMSIPFFAAPSFNAVVRPVRGGPNSPSLHFGNHLMTQLRRDFPYLRDRHSAAPAYAESTFELAQLAKRQPALEALLSA